MFVRKILCLTKICLSSWLVIPFIFFI